jgi:hypothetical protein
MKCRMGLRGEISGHLEPKKGEEEAYPQDPPGIDTGGVPSVGYPLPAPW